MKFLVNADDESIGLGLAFAREFRSPMIVLESEETRGRGEAAAERLRAAGVDAELIQLASEWLPALRAVSGAQKFDLVIVGKMWRRGMSGFLFGTVPHALLADIHANVLIVRRRREKIKRLLIAVGSGPTGFQVLRWAGLIAKAFGAQPTLIHVTERAPRMFSGLDSVDENLTRFINSNSVEAKAFQHAAATLRLIGIEPELKLARGLVVDELIAEARSGSYDLIVLGSSYTAAAASRFFMESVTDRLVQRARCPVLVVREVTTGKETITDVVAAPLRVS